MNEMNEINEMNEKWKNEMNERMNERINEWMNEWTNERTNEWLSEWMNEWIVQQGHEKWMGNEFWPALRFAPFRSEQNMFFVKEDKYISLEDLPNVPLTFHSYILSHFCLKDADFILR